MDPFDVRPDDCGHVVSTLRCNDDVTCGGEVVNDGTRVVKCR
jgi:hypothetical protein